ncbi:MAG TPA: EamA family transporter [Candidatus Avipropionibacterium avicola]|uniref:EamA family transporter n=1 Tax=Candidatus Avipropionibacterium avicola TaxID=2840701 RepID=A0A9D1GZN9_9ACTN|nr:EamA family transporter [Candidatus Avipropionibacterium avicola]
MTESQDQSSESVDAATRSIAVSPVWFVLGGIASVQIGAALAKTVFGLIDPTTMVWIRLVTAAVVLTALARPRLRGRSRTDWWVVLGYAVCMVGMNWTIYQSIARIPLGVAVTIEFLGPLAVAVLGSRRLVDLVWVGLAGVGVVLLGTGGSGVGAFGGLDPVGVLFAVAAGVCWGGYILIGGATGRRWQGISALAVASVTGAVVLAPAALVIDGRGLLQPSVLVIGVLAGVLSSVVPYSLELVALRRMRPSTFGILMSVEPAAAALAAAIILSEWLTPVQVIAVALVVLASAGAARAARRREVGGGRTVSRAVRSGRRRAGRPGRR